MINKIMILGAGKEQIPLITLAKENNLEIVLVSPKGNYPGIDLVENVYFEDVKNKENILEIAKKENINAIITDQIDVAMPTIGYINDALGFNGISYDCALKFTNKHIMKKMASLYGVNTVPFEKTNNLNDALVICNTIGYPVIIKPISSSASIGIYIVNDPDELLAYFPQTQELSTNSEVLIEKFIKGKEFVVDGFVDDYKNHNLIIGESKNFNINNLCISAERLFKNINTKLTDVEKSILSIQDLLVEKFSPVYGNVHGEYFYDEKTSKIYLNEIAIRGGGCCTTTHIVPQLTGINTIDILFYNTLNVKKTYNIEQIPSGYCSYITCILPEGDIVELEGIDEINLLPEVTNCFIDKKILNTKSKGIKNKGSKIGPVIVYSKNYEDLVSCMKKVKSTISIKVKNPNGTIESEIWY